MSNAMKGYITSEDRFLFPDTDLSNPLAAEVRVNMPRNGRAGVQLLVPCVAEAGRVTVDTADFEVEYFRMHKIPVKYNTAPVETDGEQTGNFIMQKNPPTECPPYATRLAPFFVYDCLEPLKNGCVETADGQLAAYICLVPRADTKPATYTVRLTVEADGQQAEVTLTTRVFSVEYDESNFKMIQWPCLDSANMAYHCEEPEGTPLFDEMVQSHLRGMRRMHQNVISYQPDKRCVVSEKPWRFNFDYMKPEIQRYLDAGFAYVCTGGGQTTVGLRPDGIQDKKTDCFKLAFYPEIPVDSAEGYAYLNAFYREFGKFLRENGWLDRVYFQVMDEPDSHCPNAETVLRRRVQYYMASNLLRRHIPNARVLEAVGTTAFKSGVDCMVPLTQGYENNKEEFDRMIDAGDEIWAYTCCVPIGFYLNRFLDKELLENRLLYWGLEKNRMSGYLHWAWNNYYGGMDPFVNTHCWNDTTLGTDYPAGDSFIAYPGPADNTPWLSMRGESQRKGIEDACLLKALREKDESAHDELVARVFTDFQTFNRDPAALAAAEEALYAALSE